MFHPPRSVDSWGYNKHHISNGKFLFFNLIYNGLDANSRIGINHLKSKVSQGSIFTGYRYNIGSNSNSNQIEIACQLFNRVPIFLR